MTVFTLGEATARALAGVGVAGVRPLRPARRGGLHRTGAAVRRDSIEAGTFEEMFFAVPAKGECDHMLRVARAALDAGRRFARIERSGERALSAAERALTRLTASAVRIYEEVCMLARVNRGRVYPSYDRLAAVTGLGRATVARALTALEDTGFLVRQRRFTRIEGQGAGPRYAQTSNAYRPTLPQRLLALLPRWMRPAPVPCDQAQRDADQAAELAGMKATLSARDLAGVTVGGALGRMLARLGAAIDAKECESQDDPQPHTKDIDKACADADPTGRRRYA
ncbi:helix-turn-helix domain-containing protein [Sphingomonas sp. Leaf33]|uniref:helix-turn-helix domain-containing protein n=1 Tax=Sphingomonas sp. Leaf33 TaxID=1736215 RepID=UPI0009E78E93|nr:helix-turn-helix domain-containing protein [Sphingomonas sp. Leaf33]